MLTVQIALIRHGRPRLASPRRIRSDELGVWIARYDEAGIDPALPPPPATCDLVNDAVHIVSSDLRRAVESARRIAPERTADAERLFREAGLPKPGAMPVRLDPRLWGLVARLAWFAGWSTGSESASGARARARRGAARLCELAARHGSVALVGHGLFNALLGAELRRDGWRGPVWPTAQYWSSGVYRKRSG